MKIGDCIYDDGYGWGVCVDIDDLCLVGRFQIEKESNFLDEKYIGHDYHYFDIIDYYHDRKDYVNYYKYKLRNKLWEYIMVLTDTKFMVIVVLVICSVILSIITLGALIYAD